MSVSLSPDVSVTKIAEELKLLVGYGASIPKCSQMLNTGRIVAPGKKGRELGYLVREAIKEAIATRLEGEYEIEQFDRPVTADELRLAFKILFKLSGSHWRRNSPRRREDASAALGISMIGSERFRRKGAYESQIMLVLAQVLVDMYS